MENIIEEFKKYYLENRDKKRLLSATKSEELLKEFNIEYPFEKFNEISLEDYAIGTNNKESLCYKIEFGKYKNCGPGIGGGTAFKYGIYFSKEKNNFANINGILANPEEQWKMIKSDLIKVFNSIKNAKNVDDIFDEYTSLKGMPMIIIKLAYCYFPNRIIGIAGRKQLKSVLDMFEIKYDDSLSSLKLAFIINEQVRNIMPELKEEKAWILNNMVWEFYIQKVERENDEISENQRIWMYSPGENARKWDEFYDEGIMALGWDRLGDLRQYESKKEIREKLSSNALQRNDACANWEFANVLKKGDIVYAKKGTSVIIGKGVVESDYIYDSTRNEFKSYRKVKWLTNKIIDYKEEYGQPLAQKTLTDITKYPDCVENLNRLYEQDSTILKEEEYNKYNFLDEVFIEEEKYDAIVNTLIRKKNIILEGVPGVGKTFCAKKLMYSIIGKRDDSKIRTVQFHQSYSYEDFIQGYRPNDEGKFELKNGVFFDLVVEARREYERARQANEEPKKYCIIIDEINRGNLSKVFGELMMLIESDKRDKKWSINLTYSDEDFYIPSNLYIIGTMNTADRSLAMIDYALRRRFAFIDLVPCFKNEKFRKYLIEKEKINVKFVDEVIFRYNKLNDFIKSTIGENFMIGHSYFISQQLASENYDEIYNDIVKYEIKPLLEEYYYDDKDKVNEALDIIII